MADNSIHTDQHHQDIYEMLGAYALDAVTDDERDLIEAHLAVCPLCAQELAFLSEAADTLPLGVDQYQPPNHLRDRIAAIGQTPQANERPAESPSPAPVDLSQRRDDRSSGSDSGSSRILFFAPWAAAAVLLIAVVGMFAWNIQLQSDLRERPTMETVSVNTTGAEGAQAELLYFTDQQVIVLDVRGLPQRQEEEVYQVWLFQEGQPLPAGVFGEPADLVAISANIEQYEAVGVTIEPGPLGSPEPTSDPVLVSEIT